MSTDIDHSDQPDDAEPRQGFFRRNKKKVAAGGAAGLLLSSGIAWAIIALGGEFTGMATGAEAKEVPPVDFTLLSNPGAGFPNPVNADCALEVVTGDGDREVLDISFAADPLYPEETASCDFTFNVGLKGENATGTIEDITVNGLPERWQVEANGIGERVSAGDNGDTRISFTITAVPVEGGVNADITGGVTIALQED